MIHTATASTTEPLAAERAHLTAEIRRIASLHSNAGGGWAPLYAACVALGNYERAHKRDTE
jgi:hypothetical protein